MKDKGMVAGAIALVIVALFASILLVLMFRVIPAANQHAFDGLVTALVSMVSGVIGYYFGSSRSAETTIRERQPVTVPRPLDNK